MIKRVNVIKLCVFYYEMMNTKSVGVLFSCVSVFTVFACTAYVIGNPGIGICVAGVYASMLPLMYVYGSDR